MNLMMRGIFTSQSNGKIRVGGEEAMEPNLESLGERGGGGSNERGRVEDYYC